jgi:protein-tyrosine phosphatase
MRQVPGYPLWLGHAGDVRDLRAVLEAGILAVVDLALSEPPAAVTRELVYCRFPLVDGPGNPPWLLRAAVETVAGLVRSGTPTLVYCGVGVSRTPAVVSAALSRAWDLPPAEALALVTRGGAADVSPGLWRELQAVLS